jgi:hypothetical protein
MTRSRLASVEVLAQVPDPRQSRGKHHPLVATDLHPKNWSKTNAKNLLRGPNEAEFLTL